MKVTVVGCSTSWTERPMSSYCINGNILVDCGSATPKNYPTCNIKVGDIKHIFITHLHSDHTGGLTNFFGQYINYHRMSSSNFVTIYGPKGLKEYLKHLLYICLIDKANENLENYFNIVEIDDFNQKLKVENYEISVFKFSHGNVQDIAYIFSDGKVKVGFSGDLNYQEGIDKFISSFDYGFLECCSMKSSPAHLGYDHFIELQNQFPNKKIYAIHCVDEVYHNEKQLGITCAKHSKTYEF